MAGDLSPAPACPARPGLGHDFKVSDELHAGTEGTFAATGFTEVSRPSPRRVVTRTDF